MDELGAAVTVAGTNFEVVVVLVWGALSTGAADVATTVLDELGAAVTVTGTDFVTVVLVLDGDEGWLLPLLTLVVVVSGAQSASTP